MSFATFRAVVREISLDLGASPNVVNAIHDEAAKALRTVIGNSTGVYSYTVRSAWARATDIEFESAAEMLKQRFQINSNEAVFAEAQWIGVKIVLAGNHAKIRGETYEISVAGCFENTSGHNPWNIYLSDSGKTATGRWSRRGGRCRRRGLGQTSTHAKTQEAAHKSLRRMVEQFFGVSLLNVYGATQ